MTAAMPSIPRVATVATPMRIQVGGEVRAGHVYVTRASDYELRRRIERGDFCYVLAPRQSGKSSLFRAAARALAAQGIDCRSLDLNGVGLEDATDLEWYADLTRAVSETLGVSASGGPSAAVATPAVHQFWRWLGEAALELTHPTVLVLDEIDRFHNLRRVASDDFFATLRAFVQKSGADYPEERRLTLCVSGTTTPRALIADELRTPFNVGTEVVVTDFSLEECRAFLPAIPHEGLATTIVAAVHGYTAGHPYQTAKLIQFVNDLLELEPEAADRIESRIESLVHKNFTQLQDHSLAATAKLFSGSETSESAAQMLTTYRHLLAGEAVAYSPVNPSHAKLRMSGLVKVVDSARGPALAVRNAIFARVFDRQWVDARLRTRKLGRRLHEWLDSGQRDALLLEDEELNEALAAQTVSAEVTQDEHVFITRSLMAAGHELSAAAKSRRVWTLSLSIPVLSAGLFASWYAWDTAHRSEEQKQVLQTTVERLQKERDTAELKAAFGVLRGKLEAYASATRDICAALKFAGGKRGVTPELDQHLSTELGRYQAAHEDLDANRKQYLEPLSSLLEERPRLRDDASKLTTFATETLHQRMDRLLDVAGVSQRPARAVDGAGLFPAPNVWQLIGEIDGLRVQLTSQLERLALDI